MRISILLLLTMHVLSAQAQWLGQNSGTNAVLNDVVFLNSDTGYVAGNGVILSTTDGGSLWQKTTFSAYYSIGAVCYSNVGNIYACCWDAMNDTSLVLSSNDGGNIWNSTYLPASGLMNDVYFQDQNIGFVCGEYGLLMRTTNGGTSWNIISTGTTDYLESIFFLNQDSGFIAGGNAWGESLLLRTTDGGLTWSEIVLPVQAFLKSIYFPSPLIGYLVGWDGSVAKTTDGGTHWSTQTAVPAWGNLDVFFVNDTVGYIAGGQEFITGILKTTDGGASWNAKSTAYNSGMTSIFFTSEETGYCVGSAGLILKTTNGGEMSIEEKTLEFSVYPNPANDYFIAQNMQGGKFTLELIQTNGEVIFKGEFEDGFASIPVSSYASGEYWLRLTSEEGTVIKPLMISN